MSAAVTVNHITFDCADTFTLSEFWRGLTGFCYDPEGPNEPGDEEASMADVTTRIREWVRPRRPAGAAARIRRRSRR